jgi:hypothetical protein
MTQLCVVAPLHNFICSVDESSVDLGHDAYLTPKGHLGFDADLLISQNMSMAPEAIEPWTWALVVAIGEEEEDWWKPLEMTLAALRLCKRNRFGFVYQIERPCVGGASSVSWFTVSPHYAGPEYSLEATDVDDVRAHLDHLFADREKIFEVALRRFTRGYDRETDEDRLIDYWVALEALFLPERGGELSYRAALRIAAFVEDEKPRRKELFKLLKTSYDARSAVVHGNLPKNLEGVSRATEDVVRTALGRWIKPGTPHSVEDLDAHLFE